MLKAFLNKDLIEAGIDEAGRGCLAGPVFAAAVILPKGYTNPLLNDSKKITAANRSELRLVIENDALSFGVASVDNNQIDSINILNATYLAMHKAIEKLTTIPDFLLIDGNRFRPYRDIPYKCIVKGDGKYMSIAAASILAKTYRDEFMIKIDRQHPEYAWKQNKGYPTEAHRKAIADFGITKYHRKSFRLDEQLRIF